jgi:hypothetical protein
MTLKAYLFLCSKWRTVKFYKYGPHYTALWAAFLTGLLYSVSCRWMKYKHRELWNDTDMGKHEKNLP